MSTLTVSYSGVRGVVGESLTEDTARCFGRAFGEMIAERCPTSPLLLLARDTRPSGEWITRCLLQGLAPLGPHVVDLGVVPTPTLQFYMGPREAHAGIVVTASHNPSQYNGFKFFLGPENTVLDARQTARLVEHTARNHGTDPGVAGVHPCEDAHEDAVSLHVARVLAQVDVGRIAARCFRVAFDSGQGAGGESMKRLLEALGCVAVEVESNRESEPVPENLGDLRRVVAEAGCDLGLAQDLDADRLALIAETGDPVGEEFTLVLAVDHLLKRPSTLPRVVVRNISTTRVVDEIAARHGAELVETRVGEVNLSRALKAQVDAGRLAFGGEGNGGVIYPAVSLGRDSLAAAAFVLEALADRGRPLSACVSELPHWHSDKAKVHCDSRDRLPALYDAVEAGFCGPDGRPDRVDGVRVNFPDGSWMGLRPSNTEPIVRVSVESPSRAWVEETFPRLQAFVAARLEG